MSFYKASDFSFSYEYLRQMSFDRRVPTPSKVEELARALKIKRQDILKLAANHKLSLMAERYHGEEPTTSPKQFTDKFKPYQPRRGRVQAKSEEKILGIFRLLPPERQEQAMDLLKFLRQQWRKHNP